MLGGCSRGEEEVVRLQVQLDWFPESQHGGLYQAQAKGFFAEEGLEVELLSGGNNVLVQQLLGTGKVPFGQVSTSSLLIAASEGLPIQVFANVFPNAPSVLMMHASNPIDSFEDLDGETIMARPDAIYLTFLREKYGIDFEVIPQSFGLGQFLSDPDFIQEGFYIAEFYFIEQQGVEPKALPLWESGYLNSLVLAVNGAFATEHPETVAAFNRAYRRGWRDYLQGDPAPAHEAIIAANAEIEREVSHDFLKYSRNLIIADDLARGDEPYAEEIGEISLPRLEDEVDQAVELGRIPAGSVAVRELYLPLPQDG